MATEKATPAWRGFGGENKNGSHAGCRERENQSRGGRASAFALGLALGLLVFLVVAFFFVVILILVVVIVAEVVIVVVLVALLLLAVLAFLVGVFLVLVPLERLVILQFLLFLFVEFGEIVVLFIFVIMLLGPSATSGADARGALARYSGAGLFLATALAAIVLLGRLSVWKSTRFPRPTAGLGSVEAIGKALFGEGLVVFELSGALLLVAVVGAVAVARGRQVDPTLIVEKKDASKADAEAAR